MSGNAARPPQTAGTWPPRAGWNFGLRRLVVGAALVALSACGGDGGGEDGGGILARLDRGSLPARQADFQGVVTLTGEAGLSVAVDPLAEQPSPRADVRLSPQTEILFRNGTVAQPNDLTLGQSVSVWFTEPAADEMEIDALAAAIVIEPMSTTTAPGR